MRRAVSLYERAGFTVLAAPTQLSPAFPWQLWKYWLPQTSALSRTNLVVHETLGLLWYELVSPQHSQYENQLQPGRR